MGDARPAEPGGGPPPSLPGVGALFGGGGARPRPADPWDAWRPRDGPPPLRPAGTWPPDAARSIERALEIGQQSSAYGGYGAVYANAQGTVRPAIATNAGPYAANANQAMSQRPVGTPQVAVGPPPGSPPSAPDFSGWGSAWARTQQVHQAMQMQQMQQAHLAQQARQGMMPPAGASPSGLPSPTGQSPTGQVSPTNQTPPQMLPPGPQMPQMNQLPHGMQRPLMPMNYRPPSSFMPGGRPPMPPFYPGLPPGQLPPGQLLPGQQPGQLPPLQGHPSQPLQGRPSGHPAGRPQGPVHFPPGFSITPAPRPLPPVRGGPIPGTPGAPPYPPRPVAQPGARPARPYQPRPPRPRAAPTKPRPPSSPPLSLPRRNDPFPECPPDDPTAVELPHPITPEDIRRRLHADGTFDALRRRALADLMASPLGMQLRDLVAEMARTFASQRPGADRARLEAECAASLGSGLMAVDGVADGVAGFVARWAAGIKGTVAASLDSLAGFPVGGGGSPTVRRRWPGGVPGAESPLRSPRPDAEREEERKERERAEREALAVREREAAAVLREPPTGELGSSPSAGPVPAAAVPEPLPLVAEEKPAEGADVKMEAVQGEESAAAPGGAADTGSEATESDPPSAGAAKRAAEDEGEQDGEAKRRRVEEGEGEGDGAGTG